MSAAIPTGSIAPLLRVVRSLERIRRSNQPAFDALTKREKQVLQLVADGHANPTIAQQLKISRVTVQNHRANIRNKLGIQSELDYVRYALAYDLIGL